MRSIVISFRSPRSVARSLALVVSVYGWTLPAGTAAGPPDLRVATRDGVPIVLETEELRGPSALPLLATRDRLHEQFRKVFIWFYKARIADGTAVVGRWVVDRGPLRLTMYEITKHASTPRWLRVIGTRVYLEGETAERPQEVRRARLPCDSRSGHRSRSAQCTPPLHEYAGRRDPPPGIAPTGT